MAADIPRRVVSAAIVRDGRLLLTQRRLDRSYPATWETPGGKVEVGETEREALARELAEELGIKGDVADEPLLVADLAPPAVERPLRFSLYVVEIGDQRPELREAIGLRWCRVEEARGLSLTPGTSRALEVLGVVVWEGGPAMKAKEWTEAHRREARARLYQIAAQQILLGDPEWTDGPHGHRGPEPLCASYNDCADERAFRSALSYEGRLDPARIDREVARVRALAEGRLVRETETVVRMYDRSDDVRVSVWEGRPEDVRDRDERYEYCRVRITRIRRARP